MEPESRVAAWGRLPIMAEDDRGAAAAVRSPDQRYDARGLICPLPVLRARKRLSEMAAGEILEVLATDPAAPEDFRHFCEAAGHRLLALEQEGDIARIVIARRAG